MFKVWNKFFKQSNNLFFLEIVTLKQNETACLGSAIFAGKGLGVFDSIENAVDKLVYKDKEYFSLTQAYNSGLLNENEIKKLSEIHYEHLYSENKYG